MTKALSRLSKLAPPWCRGVPISRSDISACVSAEHAQHAECERAEHEDSEHDSAGVRSAEERVGQSGECSPEWRTERVEWRGQARVMGNTAKSVQTG